MNFLVNIETRISPRKRTAAGGGGDKRPRRNTVSRLGRLSAVRMKSGGENRWSVDTRALHETHGVRRCGDRGPHDDVPCTFGRRVEEYRPQNIIV